MADTVYRTVDSDMLDAICFHHYGNETPFVEKVLDANRELAGQGPVYPAGLEIILPDLPAEQATINVVTLWDSEADVIA